MINKIKNLISSYGMLLEAVQAETKISMPSPREALLKTIIRDLENIVEQEEDK